MARALREIPDQVLMAGLEEHRVDRLAGLRVLKRKGVSQEFEQGGIDEGADLLTDVTGGGH